MQIGFELTPDENASIVCNVCIPAILVFFQEDSGSIISSQPKSVGDISKNQDDGVPPADRSDNYWYSLGGGGGGGNDNNVEDLYSISPEDSMETNAGKTINDNKLMQDMQRDIAAIQTKRDGQTKAQVCIILYILVVILVVVRFWATAPEGTNRSLVTDWENNVCLPIYPSYPFPPSPRRPHSGFQIS